MPCTSSSPPPLINGPWRKPATTPNLHVHIPFPHVLILAHSTNCWAQCSPPFPLDETDFCVPSPNLQAERIPSLRQAVRHDLVDKFCTAESAQVAMKTDPAKGICLLRLYLGRRTSTPDNCQNFQIHDFPCYLDQMTTLGLDTHYIAAQIGRALAVLHFETRVDRRIRGGRRASGGGDSLGGDHLVLGLQPVPTRILCSRRRWAPNLYLARTNLEHYHQHHCHHTERPLGTIKCIAAYFANDPYFPRPHQPELWTIFSRTYAGMAGQIGWAAAAAHGEDVLGGPERMKSLARAFLRGIEDIFKKARIKRCPVEDRLA
ncbi:hypothetical protein AYL99_10066 [Fonsecaea erecta]|uniref:DUF3669 domain-containing protein n=1 Tax=Fonsecaea erecta TaxID=1367422 RepID=A0A178Z7Z2_9EURO|nr:hypothetical protein AYL99_10066 [Fonsecaea erecta]OAP55914.1 hypothetical protein AYL99_10066 [Fonsecaea erecta]